MADRLLRLTPSADRAVRALRGDAARAWKRLEAELKSSGCHAAGYRLLDEDGTWSRYCCRPIGRLWRVITTHDAQITTVVAVGQHDGKAFYKDLAVELGTAAIGAKRDEKPDCCGARGWPTLGATAREKRRVAREPEAP